MGFSVVYAEDPSKWYGVAAPAVVVVGDTDGPITVEAEVVRDTLPHVLALVVSDRPLSVMERCRMFDSGVQHVLEPPVLGVELAARIRATQVDRYVRRVRVPKKRRSRRAA